MLGPQQRKKRLSKRYDIVVIGSGFSGICMAIKLKDAGFHNFIILERAAEIGGTWRDNDYPGCACDIPSHLYSFSFETNPGWSRMFPPQAEIQEYLQACVEKYKLAAHLVFESNVETANFNDGRAEWEIHTSSGDDYTARVVVSGMGGLS